MAKWRPRLRRLARLSAALLGGATLLGFCGRWLWLLDLFAHFRAQYLIGFLLLAGLFLWRGRRRLGALCALGAAVNAALFLPYWLRPSAPPPTGTPLKLLHANLLILNDEHHLILEQITRESPDVIALAELSPRWLAVLEPLKERYPYFVRNHTEDRFGLALWSRYPLRRAEPLWLGNNERSSVEAEVVLPDGKIVTVLATHPWPPSQAAWAASRDSQLRAAADRLAQTPGPKLLVGDLNTTPWSAIFSEVERRSGLRDTSRDTGLRFTWPEPVFVLRIPIDHVFIGGGVTVHSKHTGSPTGSDHLPLVLELDVR